MQTAEKAVSPDLARSAPSREPVVCHPIILRGNDTEVFLLGHDGRHSPPRVEIPRNQRTAPHLVDVVQRISGLHAICRFTLPDEGCQAMPRFVVMDTTDDSHSTSAGTRWVPVNEIDWAGDVPTFVCDRFIDALRQANAYAMTNSPTPFSTPRWFEEVSHWVRSKLSSRELTLTGNWTQYNMGPEFSLIRYETDSAPVWFKAVGRPNLHEFTIAAELANLHFPCLPEFIAIQPSWHGWLMHDGGGSPLDETAPLDHWKAAARSLAELQIASLPARQSLLTAGCRDLSTEKLRLQIKPFLNIVEELMAKQPVTPPRRLNQNDLRFIEIHLNRALDEQEALGIADAIGHSDLNPGNVLANPHDAVFLDWAQGHIGQPSITFEFLRALLAKLRPGYESWQQDLRKAYLDAWVDVVTEETMARALNLATLVAPFAFAMSYCSQEGVEHLHPSLEKLLRALARKMFAAARRFA
ncbi:hypothetical protein GCM10011507_34510 [Edaphobacter acidisoli]|uniref:Aminoglycoside phosphotransferase domain-containing protein n=1 Tax=Edaphobacter acidisoli TaxID=2040573 RepID=A0A916S482_9BACT|nr:hypothetical protein [Edaphobacter acidisoli]GGA80359.1 hypothetical protein GCM10011507_34510 [Edaphobacter acidisoli]